VGAGAAARPVWWRGGLCHRPMAGQCGFDSAWRAAWLRLARRL